MRRPPRSLEDCLTADTCLARLSAHAKRLLRFQRAFDLATPLARQARIANFKSGRIVIHASNGAVAAKLRQIEPRLVSVFRLEAAEVTGIDVRVQPAFGGLSPAVPRPRAGIGLTQKRALTSLADSLPDGSSLKTALTRLLKRS
jgi:hypothetical protein